MGAYGDGDAIALGLLEYIDDRAFVSAVEVIMPLLIVLLAVFDTMDELSERASPSDAFCARSPAEPYTQVQSGSRLPRYVTAAVYNPLNESNAPNSQRDAAVVESGARTAPISWSP